MLPNKKYGLADFLEIARTRAPLILVPAVVGLLAALIVSSQVPNVYQAETLIQIVPQSVPDTYVRSTVTIKTEDRLDALGNQVQSRTQLERMITELNLYQKERAVRPMQDVVEQMRASMSIETVRPNRIAPVDAFYLRFKYEDPVMAARVTERMGALYIDYNTRERGALAQGTNEFLESQLNEAKSRLEQADRKLQAFRERHSGKLPTQLQSNMQAIQSTQLQRQALVESLARDRDRKLMLERLNNDLLTAPVAVAPSSATATATNPTALATMSPRQQLDLAKANLSVLETKLKEGHPDLRRARKQVNDLETQVAALPEAGAASVPAGVTPEEVQRRERLSANRAEIESLERQVAFKESEERRLGGVIADYQSRIEAVPGVESEYLALTRDYDTIQTSFEDLLTKSGAARMAENLETRQIGEQFRVLDAPRVPSRPISPNRLLISGGGLVGGLLLGVLIGGLLEVRDGSLRSGLDVAQVLNLPVIAVVPALLSTQDRQQIHRRRWMVSGIAAALMVAAGYTFWTLRLWQFVA
jgi:polysaccharide chain length determinant protein (PEP-CTERM system associated)